MKLRNYLAMSFFVGVTCSAPVCASGANLSASSVSLTDSDNSPPMFVKAMANRDRDEDSSSSSSDCDADHEAANKIFISVFDAEPIYFVDWKRKLHLETLENNLRSKRDTIVSAIRQDSVVLGSIRIFADFMMQKTGAISDDDRAKLVVRLSGLDAAGTEKLLGKLNLIGKTFDLLKADGQMVNFIDLMFMSRKDLKTIKALYRRKNSLQLYQSLLDTENANLAQMTGADIMLPVTELQSDN